MIKQLIADIEEFCRLRGIAESTFGLLSVNDGKFVRRLREKGRCSVQTFERVRQYMTDNHPVEEGAA